MSAFTVAPLLARARSERPLPARFSVAMCEEQKTAVTSAASSLALLAGRKARLSLEIREI